MLCVSICGMQLRVDFTAPAFMALLCMLLPMPGFLQMGFACLLHESAHFLAFRCYGCKPQTLYISAVGCNLSGTNLAVYPMRQQAVILLSGVMANLLAAMVCMQAGFLSAAMWQLATAACNLLPYRSTDGGTLLYLLLEHTMREENSHHVQKIWLVLMTLVTAGFACLMLHHLQTTVAMWAMLFFLYAAEWLRA